MAPILVFSSSAYWILARLALVHLSSKSQPVASLLSWRATAGPSDFRGLSAAFFSSPSMVMYPFIVAQPFFWCFLMSFRRCLCASFSRFAFPPLFLTRECLFRRFSAGLVYAITARFLHSLFFYPLVIPLLSGPSSCIVTSTVEGAQSAFPSVLHCFHLLLSGQFPLSL